MEFSTGTFVLIAGWGAALLILWNLHRFAKAFSASFFWKTAAGLTLAAVFLGIILFFRQQRLAAVSPRVVIFPLVEKFSGRARVTPLGLAFADQLTLALQLRAPDFRPLPTASIFAFAHPDSLVDADYAARFAQGLDLPWAGWGEYHRTGALLHVQLRLLDPARRTPVLQSSFTLVDSTKIGEAAAVFTEKLVAHFELKEKKSFSHPSVSTLSAAQQSAYYSAYLNLLQRRYGPAAAETAALVQQDSTQPLFLTLATTGRMQQLRQQRADETEWQNALAVLLPKLHAAVKRDSLYAPAFILLGECYLQARKWNEAENMLRRGYALDPFLARFYVDLAQLHRSRFARDGFKNELELYQHALALNPLEVDAVLGAVEYLLRDNRRNQALALLEKYHRLNPHHLAVLTALARIHIEKGELAQALPLFETILRLDPHNVEAFYNLGIAYFHQNDLDHAARFFTRAQQIAGYPDAHMYLAQIYERRGDTTAAIPHLRERIRLSNGDNDVYAAAARKHLYGLLLRRGEIPKHLLPDTIMTK